MELCGLEEIIFDGVAGTIDLNVAETRHLFEGFDLDVHRKGRGEPIQIEFVGIDAFGL